MVATFTRSTATSNSTSSQEARSRTGGALHGWPKKRRKQRPEETKKAVPEPPDEECEPFEGEVVVGRETRWAVLWLRRLQSRKRLGKATQVKSERQRETPRVMTLAEQLHEAQEVPLSLTDLKVLPSYLQAHL
jgi:hypothetical protein